MDPMGSVAEFGGRWNPSAPVLRLLRSLGYLRFLISLSCRMVIRS